MPLPLHGLAFSLGCLSAGEHHFRDFHIRALRALGQDFDNMAIAIAAFEMHPRIDAGRILSEHLLGTVRRFEKLNPVQARDEPHAGDHVADGNLIRRLPLMFLTLEFAHIPTAGVNLLLQDGGCGTKGQATVGKLLEQLNQRWDAARLGIRRELEIRLRLPMIEHFLSGQSAMVREQQLVA
jgi:hypothetical protein